jgi:hypothetical protein
MSATLKTLLVTFLKPLLYSAIPVACYMLVGVVQHAMTWQPTDPIQMQLWQLLLLPGLAGLVKLLLRLATWKPEKVGQ